MHASLAWFVCECLHIWMTLTHWLLLSVGIIRSQHKLNEDVHWKNSIPLLLSGSRPREPLLPAWRWEEKLRLGIRSAQKTCEGLLIRLSGSRGTFSEEGPGYLNMFNDMTQPPKRFTHRSSRRPVVCLTFVLWTALKGADFNQQMSPLITFLLPFKRMCFLMLWSYHSVCIVCLPRSLH